MARAGAEKARPKRKVAAGNLVVCGDNPIWVQSLPTADTYKIEEKVAEP